MNQSITGFLMNIIPRYTESICTVVKFLQVLFVAVLFVWHWLNLSDLGRPLLIFLQQLDQILHYFASMLMKFAPIAHLVRWHLPLALWN